MHAENDCVSEQELIAHVCTVYKQFGLSEYEAYSRATELVHAHFSGGCMTCLARDRARGERFTEGHESDGFLEYARLLVGVSRLHAVPADPAMRDARLTALIARLLQAERKEVTSHSASYGTARQRLLKHLRALRTQR